MKRNSHLSLEERLQITVLQGKGISVRKIAKELGRSPSTISRKLNRPEALYYSTIVRDNFTKRGMSC